MFSNFLNDLWFFHYIHIHWYLKSDSKLLTPACDRTCQNPKWPPFSHFGSDSHQIRTRQRFIGYTHCVQVWRQSDKNCRLYSAHKEIWRNRSDYQDGRQPTILNPILTKFKLVWGLLGIHNMFKFEVNRIRIAHSRVYTRKSDDRLKTTIF